MLPHTLNNLADQLTSEAVQNLKRMIELGKKPDGQKLSVEDRQSCINVVLLWEAKHLPENKRSGYIDQQCQSQASPERQTESSDPIKLQL